MVRFPSRALGGKAKERGRVARGLTLCHLRDEVQMIITEGSQKIRLIDLKINSSKDSREERPGGLLLMHDHGVLY